MDFRDLVGIPFMNGGRDPKVGLDCWGLLMVAAGRFGFHVPDYKISCFASDEIGEAVAQAKQKQWTVADSFSPGVLLSFRIDPKRPQAEQHFGIVVSQTHFLHTLVRTGSLMSDFHDLYWKSKLTGRWKWVG